MTADASEWFTLLGLALTLLGAGVAAWAVILSPDDAAHIGVSRISGGSKEKDLKLPMVQNLLAASRWAKRGLIAIAFGTVLQIVPIAVRLLLGPTT